MFPEIEPGFGVRKPGFCPFSWHQLPGEFEQTVLPCMDSPLWSDSTLVDRVVV